jgi:hypothetical protein
MKQIVDTGGLFRSLAEPWWDTATRTGRLMIAVRGGLTDVEPDLIRTRTAEGRSRAKARGQHMGPPPKQGIDVEYCAGRVVYRHQCLAERRSRDWLTGLDRGQDPAVHPDRSIRMQCSAVGGVYYLLPAWAYEECPVLSDMPARRTVCAPTGPS